MAIPGYPNQHTCCITLIPHSSVRSVRAIHPALNLLAFSLGCLITIVNWETNASVTISVEHEEMEEAVRLMMS